MGMEISGIPISRPIESGLYATPTQLSKNKSSGQSIEAAVNGSVPEKKID